MDLRVIGGVLWRFRFVVAGGLTVALLGGLLAFVRVDFEDGLRPTFSYRSGQTWESEAMLFITQKGFPWGRAVIEPEPEGTPLPEQPQAAAGAATTAPAEEQPRYADSSRFGTLAILYATLATSDPVRELLRAGGPIDGEIGASPVLATETLDESLRSQLRYESPLPLVRVTGRADSPEAARTLAAREVDAFLTFLGDEQNASAIPGNERVVVNVLEEPREARVVEGRSKLYPALVFLGVGLLALMLPFALESTFPRRSAPARSGVGAPPHVPPV